MIDAKIAGQGNQVDQGGALAVILHEILNLAGELPVASADTLGGIKVGQNLAIDESGVLSAQGGGAEIFEIPVVSGGGGDVAFGEGITGADVVAANQAGKILYVTGESGGGNERNPVLTMNGDDAGHQIIFYWDGDISRIEW